MKIYKFLSLLFIAFSFLTSCHNIDGDNSTLETKGKLELKFENSFNNLGDIVLNQTTQTSSSGNQITTLGCRR